AHLLTGSFRRAGAHLLLRALGEQVCTCSLGARRAGVHLLTGSFGSRCAPAHWELSASSCAPAHWEHSASRCAPAHWDSRQAGAHLLDRSSRRAGQAGKPCLLGAPAGGTSWYDTSKRTGEVHAGFYTKAHKRCKATGIDLNSDDPVINDHEGDNKGQEANSSASLTATWPLATWSLHCISGLSGQ
ncbi:hypothetical protein PCASD_20289, partial [Puccinia coronata f. sp. avenae]